MADDLDAPRWTLQPAPGRVVVEVPRQEMAAADAERLAYQLIAAVRQARAMERNKPR